MNINYLFTLKGIIKNKLTRFYDKPHLKIPFRSLFLESTKVQKLALSSNPADHQLFAAK